MSLLFCMSDALSPPESEFSGYKFRPDGSGAVSIDPFPFEGEERFSLLRRVLPKTRWRHHSEFRKDLLGTEPERTSITVRAADAG
jgi:hypothetical protein